jgi:ABC-type sugar transport system ATPase subunit
VDVGARADIVAYIRGLADAGLGIIFTSSDLDEILAAATRVLVLSRGRLVGEYLAEEATEAAIAADASGPDAATLTTHACS